jgi:hypothetical protein
MSDPRLEKFSLDQGELDGLEAAIQLLAVLEAKSLVAKNPDAAEARVQALAVRRRKAVGKVGVGFSLSTKGGLATNLHRAKSGLHEVVSVGFRNSTKLRRSLAVVEVLTGQPFLAHGGDAAKKWKIDDAHRQRVAGWVLDGSGTRGWGESISVSLKAAEKSHSKLWRNVAIGVVLVAALAAGGAFAAPFIGGIIGGFMGFSGAAAVSAGLAVLGGGAVAAGGFGMLGGTVVIAAAFGAAGGGGALLFAGEGGDLVARFAAIKSQAVFAHLVELGLMDHTLAGDFMDSFEQQSAEYRRAAERAKERKSRSRLNKVAGAFQTAHDWCNELYGDAVKSRSVLDEPAAWSLPAPPEVAIQEPDFKETARHLAAAQRRLGYIREVLNNAHRLYADVKDAPYMKGLWGELSKSSRKKLQAGGSLIGVVLEEVLRLAIETELATESFAAAISKTAKLKEQRDEAVTIAARYREIVAKLHADYGRLASRNTELATRVEHLGVELNRATSRTFMVNSRLLLSMSGQKQLPPPGAELEGAASTDIDGLEAAGLDAWIACALVPSDAAFSGLAGVDDMARLPSQREVDEVIEALGLPLGADASEVKAAYREAMVEVHPDKLEGASPRIRRVLEADRRRLQRAHRMHLRYLSHRDGLQV